MIIEPDLGLFKAALYREYIGDLIENPMIDFLIGIPFEQVGLDVYKAFAKQDTLTGPRPSKCLQPEIICDPFTYPQTGGKQNPVISELIRIVQDSSKQVFLSMGCASDTFTRWEQTFRNEKNMQDCWKIKPLFKKFEGVPAIVLGAGPSLEEFILAYKQYDLKDKALIIACDASLGRLLKEGIRPHIVTRCERKFTTIFNNVDPNNTKDVFYAGYPWTPPEFFDMFEDSFMLFRDNGVCKWTGYVPGSVNGGVSSANAALEIAFLLGSKTILLSGIDLCFKDGKSHAAGAEIEFDVEKSRPKWTQVPGNVSESVTTIPVWFRCLQEYKQAIVRHEKSKPKVINTSTIGAKIEGAPFESWETAHTHLSVNVNPLEKIKANLEKHDKSFVEQLKDKKQKSVVYLKQIKSDLEKIFLFVEDAMRVGHAEEWRMVEQLKSHHDPTEFFGSTHQSLKGLGEVYKECCRQIDSFKNKYYTNKDFAELLLDTCQLDLFHTENRMNGLKNTIEMEHERLKAYIAIHICLFRLFNIYTDRMINLFERGPEKYVYEPEKERMASDIFDEVIKEKPKKSIITVDDMIREKKGKNKKSGLIYDNR